MWNIKSKDQKLSKSPGDLPADNLQSCGELAGMEMRPASFTTSGQLLSASLPILSPTPDFTQSQIWGHVKHLFFQNTIDQTIVNCHQA